LGASAGGGRGKERILRDEEDGCMVYVMYTYIDSIFKPTIYHEKKGEEKGGMGL
jgi:hypothetical protein